MHYSLIGVLGVSVIAVVLAGSPTVAGAGEPATWGVAPSSPDGPDGRSAYELQLDPGAELTDYVGVSNHSDQDLTLAVYASDAVTTADGGFDLLPAAQPPIGVGEWVTWDLPDSPLQEREPSDRPTMTVPARSRVDVPFQLRVPANATPGDHAGGIVASLATTATDQAGDQVRVEHRVGARIYLRVAGELAPALTVEQLTADYDGTLHPLRGGTLTVTYTVHNTGNVRLTPVPQVTVAGPFGLGRQQHTAEPLPELLPGHRVTATTEVHGGPPLVRLTTMVDLDAARATGPTATTWALPWGQALVLLAVAAAAALWWWRRRRIRALLAAARAEGSTT